MPEHGRTHISTCHEIPLREFNIQHRSAALDAPVNMSFRFLRGDAKCMTPAARTPPLKTALASIALMALAAGIAYAALSRGVQSAPSESPSTPAASALPHGASKMPVGAPLDNAAPAPRTVESKDKADDIGSEGYGAHIQRIADTGDAQQALKAVHWIDACQSNNEELVEHLYQIRAVMHQGPRLNTLIERTQVEIRRCQTVTPDIARLQRPLALLALQAKMPEAAAEYVRFLDGPPPAEQLPLLTAQLEVDARAGSLAALSLLVLRGEEFGLNDGNNATYYSALTIVHDEAEPIIGMGLMWSPLSPPPHAGLADEVAARAIAEKVLARGEGIVRRGSGV